MVSVTFNSPNKVNAADWDDLVRRASSNVFMNPAALLAASEADFADVQMMLAWEEGASSRRLVGVWAVRLHVVAPFWPSLLEALPYEYAFQSSPVVDPAFVDEVIPAFFAAIESHPELPNVISLRSFDAECPSYPAMLKSLERRGVAPLILSRHARPFVTREFGVKRSGSTRKKLRQDWNRLGAQGVVEVLNERTAEGVAAASRPSWRWKRRAGRARKAPRFCPIPGMPPLSENCWSGSPPAATRRWRCCASTARQSPPRC